MKLTAMIDDSKNKAISHAIEEHRDRVAAITVDLQYTATPSLAERYGKLGRARCLEDVHHHLNYLSSAIEVSSPKLFVEYIRWAKVVLQERKIPVQDLINNLEYIEEALQLVMPADLYSVPKEYITQARTYMQHEQALSESYVVEGAPYARLARQFLDSLLRYDRRIALRLVQEAVESGTPVRDLYQHVFQVALYEIGRLWQINKLSVAQEHFCTAATQFIMSQLYPHVFSSHKIGRSLIATCVGGDLHEVGIRMVCDFFEMAGWDTYYLGANTPLRSIVQLVEERKVDALALSTTISYHIRHVQEVIQAVRANPSTKDVLIFVGGYPFNTDTELWKRVGADGFGITALDTIDVANKLVAGKEQPSAS